MVTSQNGTSLCGFDLEWRVVFTKGPARPTAMLQIATHDTVFLMHLHAIKCSLSIAVMCMMVL